MRKKPEDQRHFAAQCVVNIRTGSGTSRKELSEVMAMSPSTAGLYVDQLIDAGYVAERGFEYGPMGRPKRRLEVRPEAGWFVGVEWNADRLSAVRLDFAGGLLGELSMDLPLNVSREQVLTAIESAIVKVTKGVRGRFLGIGLGSPGVVDPVEGTASDFTFISDWQKVPLKARYEDRFATPVAVGNNLRVISMAERWFGGAADLRDFIVVGPRSGFGVAIVVGGNLMGGSNGAAGEVGNWFWQSGEGMTELHHALSAPAVWRRLTDAPQGAPVPKDLRAVMSEISAKQDGCWREVAADFALVLGQLHLLLDTEAFFIHGPLCGLGKGFWEEVVTQSEVLMPRLKSRTPKVVCSSLQDNAGALGAASLSMQQWLPLL
jgi:predicted NBD/HSP70 family sugar kinase